LLQNQILYKLFFGIVEFCRVDSKKLLIVGGVGVGAYLVYKSLQLRQTIKDIQVYIQTVNFDIYKTQSNFRVIPKMVIVNPVGGTIKISNIYGTLFDETGMSLGYFQTGPVTIIGGSTAVNIPIVVSGLSAYLTIMDAITQNKWPKFTINYTIGLVGGILPVQSKIEFDSAVIKKAISYF
jgi:uncharacterized membrane protein YedE/YeeE